MSETTFATKTKKIVKTPMLRNVFIVSLVVAIAIPIFSAFLIIPEFTQKLTFGIAVILLLAVIVNLFKTSQNIIERDRASEVLTRTNENLKTEITERKIAEDALRKSEEGYREMIEASTDAIISINEKEEIIQWNQAATDLFGHDKGSIMGKSIDILIPAKYKQPHKEGLNRIIETDKSTILGKVMELEGLHKDSKTMPLELSLSGMKKDASWVFTGIIRETTERRKALKALRDSEERYRSLFEDSRDAIMIWTPNDKILGANQSALETFDYTIAEMIGLDLSQIFSNQAEQSRFNEELNQNGAVRGYEVTMRREDNSVIDILLTATVRRDKKGNILGYQGILRDVTLQKLSEKKLRNTLDTLRKAMGATIQAMSLMVESRDPYTAGHQRRVSDLARTIAMELGLPPDQIDGIRFSAIIHDLGKMAVPAEILTKPGKLGKKEFEIIKDHTQIGFDILKGIEFPWPVAQTVLEHHEKLDGSGYPQGLSDEEISLEARILCVADVVEAMASHRPYRPSLGIEKALEEISSKKGTAFDPDVVDACIKIFEEKRYQLK